MAPRPVPASVAKQAEKLKQDGNKYFKKGRLRAAIEAYTEAITLRSDEVVYWTNRALCYRKRNEWNKVEEDCRSALKLDSNSVKAHYLLGRTLIEKHDYSGATKELERALELGRGANPPSYMVEEIWPVLSRAKYMEWEDSSSKRLSRLNNLREVCEKALEDYYFTNASEEAGDGSKENDLSHQLEYLHEVFDKAEKADKPSDVPDHLCCKIMLNIFHDPVITPSGITYEKAALLKHLNTGGRIDPVTCVPLEPHQLVPNLAIKEAVQAFLSEHGWAYETSEMF